MKQLTMLSVIACAALSAGYEARGQGSERGGEEIVKAQCVKCHETGVSGAPRIDDRAAWVPRLKQGLDATVRSAIRGHGAMPARGGLADLTDTELRAAIIYMFYPAGAALKAAAAPAPVAAPDPNHRTIAGMDIYLGIMLAESARVQQPRPSGRGYYYVNISLRDSATNSEIKDAQVEARAANPVTGGELKKLEPFTVNNAASYGNYFRMQGREIYTIAVQIRRPGAPHPVEVRFDFKP